MTPDTKILQLQYFLTVADAGSLSKAALALGVGKPSIRRAVSELEQRLGVQLLVRDKGSLVLTEAGRQFHDRCSGILRNVYNISANITGEQDKRGTVSIGLPPIAAKLIAAPLLKAVAEEAPDIQLALHEGYSFSVREWLNEGHIDIGLFYDGPGTNRAFATPVMRENLLLIGAANDEHLPPLRCSLQEALRYPLIVPGRPHGNRLQIEWLAESHGFTLNIAMEVDSLTLMTRLLAAGYGRALLPAVAVSDELRRGVLRAVTIDPAFTRTLLLGRSARRMTSTRAEKLVPLLTRLISKGYESSAHARGTYSIENRIQAQHGIGRT